jgi:large subunit ribosomal protein L24
MKFKIGDKVIITAGKDKGKKSEITAVFPKEDKVLVKDINMYVKHIKPLMDRKGEKVRRERALSPAKIAILNDQDQPDRITYQVDKNGDKQRMFRKTGKPVAETKTKTATKKK